MGSLVACDPVAAREELLRVLDTELAATPQDAVWAERVLALARVLGLAGGADLERALRARSAEGK